MYSIKSVSDVFPYFHYYLISFGLCYVFLAVGWIRIYVSCELKFHIGAREESSAIGIGSHVPELENSLSWMDSANLPPTLMVTLFRMASIIHLVLVHACCFFYRSDSNSSVLGSWLALVISLKNRMQQKWQHFYDFSGYVISSLAVYSFVS